MSPEPAPSIGLALIARNEADTLPRLLDSCGTAFDEIVLVDTGSSDATTEVFERWAAEHPETGCRRERFRWCDDFSAARQYAHDRLRSEWQVWADCDDEIRGAEQLRRLAAGAPPGVSAFFCAYDYAHHLGGGHLSFLAKRERLVRAGHAHWAGRVHEVMLIEGEIVEVDPSVVRWVHHGDGGGEQRTSSPRARRDLKLLDLEIREDPNNTRAMFYLAQTHRDLGNVDRAVEFYARRAELGGWAEEVFYSRYQVGVLRAEQDWPQGLAALLDAWEFRPSRIEPLHELAWRLRARHQYRAALAFLRAGIDAPLPDDQLFVHRWIYAWGMLFEYSISGYWAGDVPGALSACERLLAMEELPPGHRTQTLANRAFCIERLRREGSVSGRPVGSGS